MQPVLETQAAAHAAEVPDVIGDEYSVESDSVSSDEDIAVVERLVAGVVADGDVVGGSAARPIEDVGGEEKSFHLDSKWVLQWPRLEAIEDFSIGNG